MIQYNIIQGLKVLALIRTYIRKSDHLSVATLFCFVSLLLNNLHRAVAMVEQHVLAVRLRLERERCDQVI